MVNIKKLNKEFQDTLVFKDMNISLEKEKTHVILGPSGVGKSTLLNIIAGIDSEYTGVVNVHTDKLAYVFQEDRLLPWLSVDENIDFVLKSQEDYSYILEMLEIDNLRNKTVKKLSGGQKQRVSIARAFATNPGLLLMDESLKSLDLELKFKIIEKINLLLKKNNSTLIYVSHDIEETLLLADFVIVLDKKGEIKEQIKINLEKSERKINHVDLFEYESVILKALNL